MIFHNIQMLSMGFKKPNSKIMCTIHCTEQGKSSVITYAQLSTTTQVIAVVLVMNACMHILAKYSFNS